MSKPTGLPESINRTLAEINAELQFPCAVCKRTWGEHNMGDLKDCFKQFASQLQSQAAELERLREQIKEK